MRSSSRFSKEREGLQKGKVAVDGSEASHA